MAQMQFKVELNDLIESKDVPNLPRGYLGMSQLGHPCKRYLVYVLREAYIPLISARTARIFERGKQEEHRVINDLQSVGVEILNTQQKYEMYGGHVRGHSDGTIRYKGEEMVLEIKTMNATAFKQIQTKGLKVANYKYWVQIQIYIHFSGLQKALYCCVNKNTEERHFFTVEYDSSILQTLTDVALLLLKDELPDKIGGISWYECKMCPMKPVCHEGIPISKHCKTCKYFLFDFTGEYVCLKDHALTDELISRGCNEWESA